MMNRFVSLKEPLEIAFIDGNAPKPAHPDKTTIGLERFNKKGSLSPENSVLIARSAPDRASVLDAAERGLGIANGWTKVTNVKLLNGNASLWVGPPVETMQGDIKRDPINFLRGLAGSPRYEADQQVREVFLVAGDSYVSMGKFADKEWLEKVRYFQEGRSAPTEHNLFRNSLVNAVAELSSGASFSLEQTYQSRQPQIQVNINLTSLVPGENTAVLNAALDAGLKPQTNRGELLIPDNEFGGTVYAIMKFAQTQNKSKYGGQPDNRPITKQVPGASQAFYRGVSAGFEKISQDGMLNTVAALWQMAAGIKGAQLSFKQFNGARIKRPVQIISRVPFSGLLKKGGALITRAQVYAEQHSKTVSIKNRQTRRNTATHTNTEAGERIQNHGTTENVQRGDQSPHRSVGSVGNVVELPKVGNGNPSAGTPLQQVSMPNATTNSTPVKYNPDGFVSTKDFFDTLSSHPEAYSRLLKSDGYSTLQAATKDISLLIGAFNQLQADRGGMSELFAVYFELKGRFFSTIIERPSKVVVAPGKPKFHGAGISNYLIEKHIQQSPFIALGAKVVGFHHGHPYQPESSFLIGPSEADMKVLFNDYATYGKEFYITQLVHVETKSGKTKRVSANFVLELKPEFFALDSIDRQKTIAMIRANLLTPNKWVRIRNLDPDSYTGAINVIAKREGILVGLLAPANVIGAPSARKYDPNHEVLPIDQLINTLKEKRFEQQIILVATWLRDAKEPKIRELRTRLRKH